MDYPKIEIIPADPGPHPEIKWKCYIRRGMPVYESLTHLRDDKPMVVAPPAGTEILVHNFFGWSKATFTGAGAETTNWIFPMEFDEEQKFWICTAVINKKCLPQLVKMFHKGE